VSEIIESTELSETTTSYQLEVGDLYVGETLEDRYQKYRNSIQKDGAPEPLVASRNGNSVP
jgi:hypothetical protein